MIGLGKDCVLDLLEQGLAIEKLNVCDGDVLLLRVPDGVNMSMVMFDTLLEALAEVLRGHDVAVCVVPAWLEVEALGNAEMEALGWVRRPL